MQFQSSTFGKNYNAARSLCDSWVSCNNWCGTLNVSLNTQDEDRDRESRVPRPRPEPRLRGSRPRPRPRLVKTGLETFRDQHSSLENSKSGQLYLLGSLILGGEWCSAATAQLIHEFTTIHDDILSTFLGVLRYICRFSRSRCLCWRQSLRSHHCLEMCW